MKLERTSDLDFRIILTEDSELESHARARELHIPIVGTLALVDGAGKLVARTVIVGKLRTADPQTLHARVQTIGTSAKVVRVLLWPDGVQVELPMPL